MDRSRAGDRLGLCRPSVAGPIASRASRAGEEGLKPSIQVGLCALTARTVLRHSRTRRLVKDRGFGPGPLPTLPNWPPKKLRGDAACPFRPFIPGTLRTASAVPLNRLLSDVSGGTPFRSLWSPWIP